MGRVALGIVICCVVLNGCSATGSGEHARGHRTHPGETTPAAAPRPRGIRPDTIKAVWVDTWGPGLFSASQCDALIQWCLDQGINTILAEIRRTGDAFYDSELEPRGLVGESTTPLAAGFDPLQYLVENARDLHGLRLEAWVVANRVWVGENPPSPSQPEHVVNAHPDWLLISREGKNHSGGKKPSWYLDPSHPGVRAHLARICTDIATRYRVDAIHLDYIRYPDKAWGYGPRSLGRFRRDSGTQAFPAVDDPQFTAWRVRQVTEQVRTVRHALRLVAPDVQLTAATIAWGRPSRDRQATSYFSRVFQDWPGWAHDDLIDLAYVMHYRREADGAQAQSFRKWIPILKAALPDSQQLVIGLGSYLNSPAHNRQQLRDALASGVAGVAMFSYRTQSNSGAPAIIADMLREE